MLLLSLSEDFLLHLQQPGVHEGLRQDAVQGLGRDRARPLGASQQARHAQGPVAHEGLAHVQRVHRVRRRPGARALHGAAGAALVMTRARGEAECVEVQESVTFLDGVCSFVELE